MDGGMWLGGSRRRDGLPGGLRSRLRLLWPARQRQGEQPPFSAAQKQQRRASSRCTTHGGAGVVAEARGGLRARRAAADLRPSRACHHDLEAAASRASRTLPDSPLAASCLPRRARYALEFSRPHPVMPCSSAALLPAAHRVAQVPRRHLPALLGTAPSIPGTPRAEAPAEAECGQSPPPLPRYYNPARVGAAGIQAPVS
ncbi:unnamed protein product [Urochloa humidicola]